MMVKEDVRGSGFSKGLLGSCAHNVVSYDVGFNVLFASLLVPGSDSIISCPNKAATLLNHQRSLVL